MATSKSEFFHSHENAIQLDRASVFPIASFLSTERSLGLTLPYSDLLFVPLWSPNTESYLLTQAVRRIDLSGTVPPLLGISHNPQETMSYMIPEARKALDWLKDQGEFATKEALDALLHNGPCSICSLGYLDKMWGSIVAGLKNKAFEMGLAEQDRMTSAAEDFRTSNVESLNALKDIYGLQKMVDRKLVDGTRDLRDITEQLIVPVVEKEQAAKLLSILPDVFNREKNIDVRNYNLEVQILRRLGKVGNDLTRTLIHLMRDRLVLKNIEDHDSCRQ